MSPVTAIVDPAFQVKNLLATNWTPANTRSVTPVFSTGWFAESRTTQAQVTATDPRDGLRQRTLTPTGAGQFRDGTVTVNCWVPERMIVLGSAVDSGGAKKLADLMRTEVDRIVTENQNLMADFEQIEIVDTDLLVEFDRTPVIYRWLIIVGFSWIKSP